MMEISYDKQADAMYIEKLKKIEKQKGVRFKSLNELRRRIDNM